MPEPRASPPTEKLRILVEQYVALVAAKRTRELTLAEKQKLDDLRYLIRDWPANG